MHSIFSRLLPFLAVIAAAPVVAEENSPDDRLFGVWADAPCRETPETYAIFYPKIMSVRLTGDNFSSHVEVDTVRFPFEETDEPDVLMHYIEGDRTGMLLHFLSEDRLDLYTVDIGQPRPEPPAEPDVSFYLCGAGHTLAEPLFNIVWASEDWPSLFGEPPFDLPPGEITSWELEDLFFALLAMEFLTDRSNANLSAERALSRLVELRGSIALEAPVIVARIFRHFDDNDDLILEPFEAWNTGMRAPLADVLRVDARRLYEG